VDTIDTFLDRNTNFAQSQFAAGLRIVPQMKTLLLGCLDPRVDPAHVLGVAQGEVGIIRNVGGRVTPDVVAEIALLVTLTKTLGGALGPGWDLIVLQHTDCGILRLQDPPDRLADLFDVEPAALGHKHVGDPRAAITTDIAVLRDSPLVPATFRVTGMLYDVDTGRIEVVEGPERLRGEPEDV